MPRPGPAPTPSKSRRPAPMPPPRALRGAASSELSLVAAYDDLTRNGKVIKEGAEKKFLQFVKLSIVWKKRFQHSEGERSRLLTLLRERENELTAKDYKIKQARRMVEDERRGRLAAEADRERFAAQLDMVKDLLLSDETKRRGLGLDNETLERVRHIDTTRRNSPYKDGGGGGANNKENLAAVEESCESILDVDDLSFDETGGDLLGGGGGAETSRRHSQGRRRSSGKFDQAQKRRKSRSVGNQLEMTTPAGNVLTATTTMMVDAKGNTHSEAVLESIPLNLGERSVNMKDVRKAVRKSRESQRRVTYNEKPEMFSPSAPPAEPYTPTRSSIMRTPSHASPVGVIRHFSNASSIPNRPHNFIQKRAHVAEKCGVCLTRIQFRKTVLKCRDCGAIAHFDCRSKVPKPCVAASNRTPSKTTGGMLADYTPLSAPMVPAILIHCVREVEARGLSELGIYRIPGSEAQSLEILDKFLKAKSGTTPAVGKFEIHAVCSAIKKFLRSLKEPVIPSTQWRQFVDAANNPDTTDGEAAMIQAVSELPRPNRDTLAFLILHLQKVALAHDCKMPVDSLAMVMGPTIIGYSSTDPSAVVSETAVLKQVMRLLLTMSNDYWASFLHCESENLFPRFTGNTPERPNDRFVAPSPMQSAVARRTRSRLSVKPPKPQYFQSPMLFQ